MGFVSFGLYLPSRNVRLFCWMLSMCSLVGITVTGNFNFFSILAIALGLNFLDDDFIEFWMIYPLRKLFKVYHDEGDFKDLENAAIKDKTDNFKPKNKIKNKKSGYKKRIPNYKIYYFNTLIFCVNLVGFSYLFMKLFSYDINSSGKINWKIIFNLRWLKTVIITPANYNMYLNYVFLCTLVNSFFYLIRVYSKRKATGLTIVSFGFLFYLVMFSSSLVHFSQSVGIKPEHITIYQYGKQKIDIWNEITSTYHLHNGYGLFRRMTGVGYRPEFIIQYQTDGYDKWFDYQFKDKVGNLDEMPRINMPHQARLDWQLWFVALAPERQEVFLYSLLYKLMTGEKKVMKYVGLWDRRKNFVPKRIRYVIYKYY